jgi:dTDP-4-dehydrorhamnose reductase
MKMKMKILIYGGNGWIGTLFTKFLKEENIEYILGNARVDDTYELKKEINNIKPSNIISFIGRTSGIYNGKNYNTIDYLEQPGNLSINIRDNLYSPLSLGLICNKKHIHLTYLGTGCIFNYDEYHKIDENGWTEDDTPNFFGSSYSIVKGYTDRLMHLLEENVLNLRIRMPIIDKTHPKNFITKITNYNKICSIPNSMTILEDFFPIWLDLIKKNSTGTYNCTNPGTISHNEILQMYKDIVDKNFIWENFSIEEQNKILDSKRSNNFLNTNKLTQLYNIRHIKNAIQDIFNKLKN